MTNKIKYYGHVNSHDKLKDIASSTYLEDEYGSRDVQNIEVPEEYFLNKQEYGTNYYMYSNGEIVLNPNWAETYLAKIKAEKYEENNEKADEARYNKYFVLTVQEQECLFDTTEKTQTDLNTAANYCIATGGTYDGWVTNNGVELDLTLEDVALIGAAFKTKANVYDKWKEYKQAIDEAETVEEVEAIVIDYTEEE